jgi:hypothetical protein
MKTIIILSSILFLTSCLDLNDKKCFFADSIIELSNEELEIHQNRGKSMLTIEDRKKLYENEKQFLNLYEKISNEYGTLNRDIMNEVMDCSDTRDIISKNSDIIEKIKSEREIDDYCVKKILNKKKLDFNAMSACETLETMCQLANYQYSLFEKYSDLTKSNHKDELIKVIKISAIVYEIIKKNHSEDEVKKCAYFETFMFMTEKLGQLKKDM